MSIVLNLGLSRMFLFATVCPPCTCTDNQGWCCRKLAEYHAFDDDLPRGDEVRLCPCVPAEGTDKRWV